MRSSTLGVVVLVTGLGFVLGGCPDREVSRLDPVPTATEDKTFPFEINNKVDLLFVIDNSESMSDEQASLRANFQRFIEVLDNLQGGLPDVHIGVVTTDLGSLGAIQDPQQCGGDGDAGVLHVGTAVIDGGQTFLADGPGAAPGDRIRNYDQGGAVTLTQAFGQIADVGTDGCGFEQQLASIQVALEQPANTGFIRADAHLAVIVITDEDDCSAYRPELFVNNPALGPLDSFRCFEYGVVCDEPPADPRIPGVRTNCRPREDSMYLSAPDEFAAFLDGFKAVPDDVIVASIMGDRDPVEVGTREVLGQIRPTVKPSCTYDNPDPAEDDQNAAPSIRIGAFLDHFGERGQEASICNEDLSGPLQQVGNTIIRNIGNACIEGELTDIDPSTPELDWECAVHWTGPADSADGFDEVLPECDASASVQPCWRLAPAERCVDYPTGLAFEIVSMTDPPDGTRINTSCVVE